MSKCDENTFSGDPDNVPNDVVRRLGAHCLPRCMWVFCHCFATVNVVIYVIRLTPCFLKPALYFIFDKAGGRKSNFADRNLTSAKGYPCQYKGILRALDSYIS